MAADNLGDRFDRHIVEEELHRHVQYARHVEQAAGADPVRAALIFLDLLEVRRKHRPMLLVYLPANPEI